MPVESITGVVLAGGRSSRMGTDKARLQLEARTLVERSVSVLQQCFPQVLVIANDPSLREDAVPDDAPGLGPLGGIATAMRRATTADIFVVACDMPFLNPALIIDMAARLNGWDAVAVPGEQLHAAYACSVLPVIDRRIAAGDLSVHGLLKELRVTYFSETELQRYPDWQRSFFNVNTPEEFARARAMAEGD